MKNENINIQLTPAIVIQVRMYNDLKAVFIISAFLVCLHFEGVFILQSKKKLNRLLLKHMEENLFFLILLLHWCQYYRIPVFDFYFLGIYCLSDWDGGVWTTGVETCYGGF